MNVLNQIYLTSLVPLTESHIIVIVAVQHMTNYQYLNFQKAGTHMQRRNQIKIFNRLHLPKKFCMCVVVCIFSSQSGMFVLAMYRSPPLGPLLLSQGACGLL